MKTSKVMIAVAVLLVLGLCIRANAADKTPVAEVLTGSYGLSWNPLVPFHKLTVTVGGPDGNVIKKTFEAGQIPGFDLSDLGNKIFDGSYNYELTVTPIVKNKNGLRGSDTTVNQNLLAGLDMVQSGSFTVKGGSIVSGNVIENGAPGASGTNNENLSSIQAQTFTTDVIVQGSECVGVDCSSSESFGFDTLRFKENNLRVHFNDTSTSSSFPKNDWRILINDSSNGGAEYFAVEDSTAGKVPFKIEAGAPVNTLYVENDGDVGIKTSNPVVDLHIVEGNSPTVRLEQDGSDGFTPQTWDLAGNETNFFIRDVTNGSKLGFRIQPGTPESTLSLKSSGRVGLGTWSPSYPLHVKTGSGTNAAIVLEHTSNAQAFMNATTTHANVGSITSHPVRFLTNNTAHMTLNTDLSVTMGNGASLTAAGVWTNASSRELKENIKSLSSEDAVDALKKLEPVSYNYKLDKSDKYVGFIAEDVPELVASKTRKGLSPMDVVAVLTKVVQEQQTTISKLEKKMAELEKKQDKK